MLMSAVKKKKWCGEKAAAAKEKKGKKNHERDFLTKGKPFL